MYHGHYDREIKWGDEALQHDTGKNKGTVKEGITVDRLEE